MLEEFDPAILSKELDEINLNYKTAYATFDTNNVSTVDKDNKFVWILDNTKNQQIGTVNVSSNFKNIVGIKILPSLMLMNGVAYSKTMVNDFYHAENLTICIEEIKQSYIAKEGRKYQFLLEPKKIYNSINQHVEYTSVGNNIYFWLDYEQKELSKISLTFGIPNELLTQQKIERAIVPMVFYYI